MQQGSDPSVVLFNLHQHACASNVAVVFKISNRNQSVHVNYLSGAISLTKLRAGARCCMK